MLHRESRPTQRFGDMLRHVSAGGAGCRVYGLRIAYTRSTITVSRLLTCENKLVHVLAKFYDFGFSMC